MTPLGIAILGLAMFIAGHLIGIATTHLKYIECSTAYLEVLENGMGAVSEEFKSGAMSCIRFMDANYLNAVRELVKGDD